MHQSNLGGPEEPPHDSSKMIFIRQEKKTASKSSVSCLWILTLSKSFCEIVVEGLATLLSPRHIEERL